MLMLCVNGLSTKKCTSECRIIHLKPHCSSNTKLDVDGMENTYTCTGIHQSEQCHIQDTLTINNPA